MVASCALLAGAAQQGLWQWAEFGVLALSWGLVGAAWGLLSILLKGRYLLGGYGLLQAAAAVLVLALQPQLAWVSLSMWLTASAAILWGGASGLSLQRVWGALAALCMALPFALVYGEWGHAFALPRQMNVLLMCAVLLPLAYHAALACLAVRQQRNQYLEEISNLEQECLQLSQEREHLLQAVSSQNSLAEKDFLTGVNSLSRSMETINFLRERNARKVESFCVVLLELDPWVARSPLQEKSRGPSLNDKMLLMLSGLLMTQVRTVDSVGRYLNEAFILVLPDTSSLQAIWVLHRIRESMRYGQWGDVQAKEPAGTSSLSVTLTMAVAEYQRGESAEELMQRAEAALMHGHALGSDQIVVAEDLNF